MLSLIVTGTGKDKAGRNSGSRSVTYALPIGNFGWRSFSLTPEKMNTLSIAFCEYIIA
jgi:hypothetical protein